MQLNNICGVRVVRGENQNVVTGVELFQLALTQHRLPHRVQVARVVEFIERLGTRMLRVDVQE